MSLYLMECLFLDYCKWKSCWHINILHLKAMNHQELWWYIPWKLHTFTLSTAIPLKCEESCGGGGKSGWWLGARWSSFLLKLLTFFTHKGSTPPPSCSLYWSKYQNIVKFLHKACHDLNILLAARKSAQRTILSLFV